MNDLPRLLATVLEIYSFVLLARIIMSWIPNLDRGHPIAQLLYQLTEPVLEPIRRTIPPLGMIDLSPLLLFFAIRILQGFLYSMGSGY